MKKIASDLDAIETGPGWYSLLGESGGTAPAEGALHPGKMPDPEKNPFDALTERERLVAKTLALGIPSRTIASELHIASKTVGSHRAAILRKVGATNNVDLARLAIRWGVVPPP